MPFIDSGSGIRKLDKQKSDNQGTGHKVMIRFIYRIIWEREEQ